MSILNISSQNHAKPSTSDADSFPSLKKLALKLGIDGPVKTVSTPRKVQILYNGAYVLATTNAVFVWEHPFYPQYYVPTKELISSSKTRQWEFKEGEVFKAENGTEVAMQCTIKVGTKSTDQVLAFSSENLSGKAEELKGMTKIDFASMDQWFEEETPIYVHPKDPFKRVDILQSTRDIKVFVDGQVVAKTQSSMHLYETGLPVRFYIPLTAIDASVLRPSTTKTKCPYKGEAEYYSVEVNGKLHEDLFWYYRNPTLESSKVQGLCCPYSERVDIELDGVKLDRPKTHFGPPKESKKPSAI